MKWLILLLLALPCYPQQCSAIKAQSLAKSIEFEHSRVERLETEVLQLQRDIETAMEHRVDLQNDLDDAQKPYEPNDGETEAEAEKRRQADIDGYVRQLREEDAKIVRLDGRRMALQNQVDIALGRIAGLEAELLGLK